VSTQEVLQVTLAQVLYYYKCIDTVDNGVAESRMKEKRALIPSSVTEEMLQL
jgi:hypothetical protein